MRIACRKHFYMQFSTVCRNVCHIKTAPYLLKFSKSKGAISFESMSAGSQNFPSRSRHRTALLHPLHHQSRASLPPFSTPSFGLPLCAVVFLSASLRLLALTRTDRIGGKQRRSSLWLFGCMQRRRLPAVWRDRRGGTAAGDGGAWPASRPEAAGRPSSGMVLRLRLQLHAGEPRGCSSSGGAWGARRRAAAVVAARRLRSVLRGARGRGNWAAWAVGPAHQRPKIFLYECI